MLSCKYLARTTVVASTYFGTFLPFVSSYSHVVKVLQVGRMSSSFNNYGHDNNLKYPAITTMSSSSSSSSSSKIRQFSSSSNQEEHMTKDAMQIIHDAIRAVNPYTAIGSNFVRVNDTLKITNKEQQLEYNLPEDYDEIVIVAFGKASTSMATAVVQQIFPKIKNNGDCDDSTSSGHNIPCRGVVICKDEHITANEREVLTDHGIEAYEASHPVPDARSSNAADKLLQMVSSRASPRTLVICCISGGGSSLFCRPTPPLTLQDLQQVNSVLLANGMDIQEMNVLRKRLEQGKGGRLAAACFPSHVVALILSDVIGDPLDLIASGPTVPDTSTWEDGWRILQQYNLKDKLPKVVVDMLQNGKNGRLEDSPSADHPVFENTKNILVGNNALAVEAASNTARSLGYNPVVLGTEIEGEAKEIANVYTAMASYLQNAFSQKTTKNSITQEQQYMITQSLPTAIIAGGETTVTLTPNSGKGGRNQELALSAALKLESLELRNVVLASVGTDGGDGPTDAAGAVVDATTIAGTRSQALEALANHNAYPYLDGLKGTTEWPPLIKTGPTGTNVADICVTLIKAKPE
ncbi:glycerate kinase [Fragilariopsis cylindrus CCMP1102]|uniref:Glycerate kinase n=1 Tax=Fragilariopsis cylindrus CCMP1102 TaxID=635003 RepID=A0A1E7F8L1_9STRA|nr:glycerate kinase [Fragilariopsis cylindrus CCMP1102]|eukprot:OEU14163.1 glycerate kinase [Fragilariopsis cylindrus CCMP1102]